MKRNCCFFALVLWSVFLPAIRSTAGDCFGIDYYLKSPPAPPGFPGSRDLSFHPTNVSGGWIWRVVALSNGKIMIADGNGLARLNADGSPEAGFVASITDQNLGPLNNEYTAIALQPDGKILVAGNFDSVNGSLQPFIARLNPNGSSDESFLSPFTESDLTNVFRCGRWSLALQADGKVLVAGGFVRVGQINRSGFARLNADGSLDLTFSPDPIFPAQGERVNAIVIQPDQKLLIGASYGIYRLNADGSLDASFGDGSGLQGKGVGGYASLLALQPDGKVLAGWSVPVLASWSVERLNPDGTTDSGFEARFGGVQSCGILSIALQTNGKIMVGGDGVVRLNPDGGLDAGFDLAAGLTEALEIRAVWSLAIQTDGQVVIAGIFVSGGFVETLVRVHGGEWPMILPRSVRRLPTGEFQFQATGPTNQTWIIQATTNLAAPNWTAIATNTLGTAASTFTDSTAATIPRRFYRAVLGQ